MWKLTNIQATNLCAFKEFAYTLNQGVTTLVFGNNLDNDSQVSNGSGKSALIEAIAIGLTGETLRKIKMDEIINDSADEALVCLELTNDYLSAKMHITRKLSRKNPQAIELIINDEQDVQASVLEYNRVILEHLGLTKDDIFANYILSKHKYASFLSSSDREKKEIINRFSNGMLVDEAIAALQEELEAFTKNLEEAERTVANYEGRVSALNEQINNAALEAEERLKKKQSRIDGCKESIAQNRTQIRECREKIREHDERLRVYDDTYNHLRDLEESSISLDRHYQSICRELSAAGLPEIKDFRAIMQEKQKALKEMLSNQTSIQGDYNETRHIAEDAQAKHAKLQAQREDFDSRYADKYTEVKQRIDVLLNKVDEYERHRDNLDRQSLELKREMATIEQQLAGIITCPSCGYEFMLNLTASVSDLRQKIGGMRSRLSELAKKAEEDTLEINTLVLKGKDARAEQRTLEAARAEWDSKLADSLSKAAELERQCTQAHSRLVVLSGNIATAQDDIANLQTQMYDEAFDLIDQHTRRTENQAKELENNIKDYTETIDYWEGVLKQLEGSSDDDVVESLSSSKAKYEDMLHEAEMTRLDIATKVAAFQAQESHFIQFKTHLANSKIEALSHMTNEFLERIGSDIRIAFSGFTVLKSGKIRDKISISLLRDGIDGGSYDKYSEGEKSRANLANILALHKLTNVNCEEGKGLDLLILDEILEACDESGLASMFEALNSLHITSLVVSHGNIAEGYPHKLIVNKQNGISFIS